MVRILGIDPGLQHTGWGIIDRQDNHLSYVVSGTVSPSSSLCIDKRLLLLSEGIERVLARYKPDYVAIEETFVNNNAATSLKLGQARGALILTVSLAGVPLTEYATRLIKKTVVGVGKADKGQVLMMVKHLLPQVDIHSEDEADALATAICHASHSNIEALIE